MNELFVPAMLTGLNTLDPGEIREIQLTLPSSAKVNGVDYPILDTMRPGTAFLAKPFGLRTEKYRRRMYTRSNCCLNEPRILETIINDTHQDKADTSPWWQSPHVEKVYADRGAIDVRVMLDQAQSALFIYESASHIHDNNLRLEPDDEWPTMQFLCLAFSTGITPFLAHLRYMKLCDFGRKNTMPGVKMVLIASARNPRQLMAHDELLELEGQFPENVRYHPVLTREWANDWPYTRGRIIRETETLQTESTVSLAPLLAIVPDIEHYHVRMCGNRLARDQLLQGFEQHGQTPLSFRAEIW